MQYAPATKMWEAQDQTVSRFTDYCCYNRGYSQRRYKP